MKHKNIKNLTGKKFGRLTVLSYTNKRSGGAVMWLCVCDCKNKKLVSTGNLNPIRRGSVQSCGCLKREILIKQQTPTHGMTKTRPYRIWNHMLQRCENKKDKDFKNYGGIGINISLKWHNFNLFWNDMKEGYSNKLSINRIDNNGNYELGNCNWVSQKEQGNNTRVNTLIKYKNTIKTLSQWSDLTGIHRTVISYRIKSGWNLKYVFTVPVDYSNRIYKK